MFVWRCPLSPRGPLEVWKHEWYHVVTNYQGHVLGTSGLQKVAKIVKKKAKSRSGRRLSKLASQLQ